MASAIAFAAAVLFDNGARFAVAHADRVEVYQALGGSGYGYDANLGAAIGCRNGIGRSFPAVAIGAVQVGPVGISRIAIANRKVALVVKLHHVNNRAGVGRNQQVVKIVERHFGV